MPSHGLCKFYIGLVLFGGADRWGRQGTVWVNEIIEEETEDESNIFSVLIDWCQNVQTEKLF